MGEELKISDYSVDSLKTKNILKKGKITSDDRLARLDKSNDKIITEDELQAYIAENETESQSETDTSINKAEETNKKMIQILMKQRSELEQKLLNATDNLGGTSDSAGLDGVISDISSIRDEINETDAKIVKLIQENENYISTKISDIITTKESEEKEAQRLAQLNSTTTMTNSDTEYTPAAQGTTSYPSAPVAETQTPETVPIEETSAQTADNSDFANKFNSSSFSKGVLSGQGDMVANVANKYGLDPSLLSAIMALETEWGTSDAIKNYNNPGGMMDPKTNWMKFKKYSTLQEGMEAVAKNLKNNYINKGLTTISSIGAKYCPVGAANDPNGTNSGWIPGVVEIYNKLTGKNINSNTKLA